MQKFLVGLVCTAILAFVLFFADLMQMFPVGLACTAILVFVLCCPNANVSGELACTAILAFVLCCPNANISGRAGMHSNTGIFGFFAAFLQLCGKLMG